MIYWYVLAEVPCHLLSVLLSRLLFARLHRSFGYRKSEISVWNVFLEGTNYYFGGNEMANIKSAKKRILTSQKRAASNKAVKSGVKTAVKKVRAAIEANDTAAAASAFENAKSVIDKAASKGVLHKNTAARKVSRLAAAVKKAQ